MSAFNNMERVFIGGKTNAMEKLVKPFHGTISGESLRIREENGVVFG